MAKVESAFIAKVIAVGGAEVGGRVWPLVRTQGSALPAQVVNVVSEVRGVHHGGASGLTEFRIQVDTYGATFAQARAAAVALADGLHGWKGAFGGVEFQGVFQDSRRDSFEGEAPDRVFRISQDFNVWAVAP